MAPTASPQTTTRPPLAERLEDGRYFEGNRSVRLGDVRPDGTLRLDALMRYTQDVSNDDTTAAQLPDDLAWVVRRTAVDVFREASFGEPLRFGTFCAGLGRRWAERRLSVTGESGAHYEVSTLWIHLDSESGRPKPLGDRFLEIYGSAAGSRSVSARLLHPDPPGDAAEWWWPLRAVDFDLFDHVNNAAYWAAAEERRPIWFPLVEARNSKNVRPWRATMEYRAGIGRAEQVRLREGRSDDRFSLWFEHDDQLAASLVIEQ